MSARGKARKRALDIIFEADSKGVPIEVVAAEHHRRRSTSGDIALPEYTVTVVEGVARHGAEIDALINEYAQEWTVERMPAVDRAIARVAVYEIAFGSGVPREVAIAEAVRLAAELSTDESPKFIQGLLGGIPVGGASPSVDSVGPSA